MLLEVCSTIPTDSQAARGPTWWFADEMYVSISGQHLRLWRTVDQDGDVLDTII
ncbi:MAG: DDE-type integrase/transposase/recombinase [Gammaproteobacteria bacterium]|nr:DDE-type integrase/transposase/recombinase [Gammaproteobacteria bacterium]